MAVVTRVLNTLLCVILLCCWTGTFAEFRSCTDVSGSSGTYSVRPDGAGASYDAHCDMDTDGGGWMLVLNYEHAGGTNAPLVELTGSFPPMSSSAYSHVHLSSLGYSYSDVEEVRVYCKTNLHNRIIHFKTGQTAVKEIAFYGTTANNTVSAWTTGYTALVGHTANLPAATTTALTGASSAFAGGAPFYVDAQYHYVIRAGGRWECDDWPNSNGATTAHRVWVRMKAVPTVAPTPQPTPPPTTSIEEQWLQQMAARNGATPSQSPQFTSYEQLAAFEFGATVEQALLITTWEQMKAVQLGVDPDQAVQFTRWEQIRALQLGATPEQALQFATWEQLRALDRGYSVEDALLL